MRIGKYLIWVLACTFAAFSNASSFISIDAAQLKKTKVELQAKPSDTLLSAYKALISDADSLLNINRLSVVDKTILPPSKNPKDYLSISRYWWPDPSKEDGLPWIRRDGITNPETQTDAVDRRRLGRMAVSVNTLALAFYFSDQDKYAKKASELIDAWFLNDKTGMNPHLEFAQSVPGNPQRRRSGILDGRLVSRYVLDAISLIQTSEYWTEAQDNKMNGWLSAYLTWLTKSDLGRLGALQINNHGSWYFFQTISLAKYLSKHSLMKAHLNKAQLTLREQFNEVGLQAHELTRTRPYFYSCFNLNALTSIAALAERVDFAFWQTTAESIEHNADISQHASTALLPLGIEILLPNNAAQYRQLGEAIPSDCFEVFAEYARYSGNKDVSQELKRQLELIVSEYPNSPLQLDYRKLLLH